VDAKKLAVRDRKRNSSRSTPASAQRLRVGEVCRALQKIVEGWRIELNSEVLERYDLCDYRLGLCSVAGNGFNCCRVAGDCGYIQCEGENYC